jgi:hypothetical protein
MVTKLLQVYGEGAMIKLQVCVWVKQFQDGREDVTNNKISDHATTQHIARQVHESGPGLFPEDRLLTPEGRSTLSPSKKFTFSEIFRIT